VQVRLKSRRSKEFTAQLEPFEKADLKQLNEDWKFNWKELYKAKALNEAYYVMNNIEVAPWNYGSSGKFRNIADILISYACLKSFELNKGNYNGFLVFTSKGTLIERSFRRIKKLESNYV